MESINPSRYVNKKDLINRIYSIKRQKDPGNWDISEMDSKQTKLKVKIAYDILDPSCQERLATLFNI